MMHSRTGQIASVGTPFAQLALLASVVLAVDCCRPGTVSEREQKRRALNERFDKLRLRTKTGFVVDCMNGTFAGRGVAFGHPALAVIAIPSEERPTD